MIQFRDYAKTSASIRVTTSVGVRTTLVDQITYTVLNPNGDECPPVCKQANVTALLPV